MRIAYCEDEPAQFLLIKDILDEWRKKTGGEVILSEFCSAEEMLFENPNSFPYDLIILDIELKKMNGIELARQIRKTDNLVQLVFLSNRKEYVFEGYEVSACRYLLKPLTKEQLYPLLDKIQKQRKAEKQYLIVNTSEGEMRIDTKDIYYLEAVGHYIMIYKKNSEIKTKNTMKELFKRLPEGQFYFSHRSFIVNISVVEQVTRTECVLDNASKVMLSRNMYKNLNEAFITYYKGDSNIL